jgi:hypothetical protein
VNRAAWSLGCDVYSTCHRQRGSNVTQVDVTLRLIPLLAVPAACRQVASNRMGPGSADECEALSMYNCLRQ